MTAALIRKIHVGCRQLGIDSDTRHDLQLQLVGKASLSDMTEPELLRVVSALNSKGFAPSKGKTKRKEAPRADLRLVHVLWTKLGHAGALETPTRKGLNTFLRSQFETKWGSVPADVDMLRDHTQIDDVLQALMAWGKRAGIDFDWSRIGK
ncbi:MAG: gp16 family protein [Pelagimonas sp.]|uniref:gp16 family protein n=1 Tax=Pelagimonas sp. TaxID=2073170 RepID=UPI003D6AEEEA